MNFNQQPSFDWSRFWDVVDDNVRANIPSGENAETRRGRGGRRDHGAQQPDEYADYWANAIRAWGAPWMNMPMHGGPPHRGPHPPPPGRAGPPPPPPGHEGHPPPPPPPGPHGPPPPSEDAPSDPPSRSPTPSTPGTPEEELPEYPDIPHEGPHHGPPHGHHGPHHPHHHRHGRRGDKGKHPEDGNDSDRPDGPSRPRHHPHRHGPGHYPFFGPGRRGRCGRRNNFGGWGGMNSAFPFTTENAENLKNLFNTNSPWSPFVNNTNATTNDAFTPQYEVYDKTDKVIVFVSLAGAKKENVDVAYDPAGHSLTISGVVARPEEVDEEMFALKTAGNRNVGYFNVKVDLPSFWGVVEDIKAKMEDGVLRVEVGKPGDEDWEEVRKVRVE